MLKLNLSDYLLLAYVKHPVSSNPGHSLRSHIILILRMRKMYAVSRVRYVPLAVFTLLF